jgi:hypothetical protein
MPRKPFTAKVTKIYEPDEERQRRALEIAYNYVQSEKRKEQPEPPKPAA